MATIKLSSLISDIRGSIENTTFKRIGNTHVAYGKQAPQYKSYRNKNNVINKNNFYLQQWATLDENTKAQWIVESEKYLFPDNNGNLKNLTGRQFFLKMNSQLLNYPNIIVIESMTNVIETILFNFVNIDWLNDQCVITHSPATYSGKIFYHAQRLSRGTTTTNTKQGNKIFEVIVNQNNEINIFGALDANFNFIKIGDKFQITFYSINDWGFHGVKQKILITIQ